MPEKLPFGKVDSLDQEGKRVSALEMQNEVLWVNPEMELPFKLEVGNASSLGVFFSERPERRSVAVHRRHQRSALLGRAIFRDKQGRLYRDIDAKGTGYVGEFNFKVLPSMHSRNDHGPIGVTLLDFAEHDRDMTEQFLQAGIRTYRVAAIIALKEVIYDNEVTSVDEVKNIEKHTQNPTLRESEVPVVEVRAFATKMRISDAREETLEDAIELVAQEQNLPEMSKSNYLNWFAVTLGTQLGKMHKLGYTHNYLTPHNITLDCRIVDLDSVAHRDNVKLDYSSRKEKDEKEAYNSLIKLISACNMDTMPGVNASFVFSYLGAYEAAAKE